VVIDGVFGYQFRPPLSPAVATLLATVNALDVRLRAAVDLPSGLEAPDAFQADFTYAAGILKTPLLTLPRAGRIRYRSRIFQHPGYCGQSKVSPNR
jgi:NAD(P)H-hydrate epimerase